MLEKTIDFIRDLYGQKEFIPLHEPYFSGNEKNYLNDCIDTTFVSSVGKYVDEFEEKIAAFTGSKYAVATVNGTSALHVALLLAEVGQGDEVITQPLTFVATCNAINYLGAFPVFVDVDRDTLSMSPQKLEEFLKNNTIWADGGRINKHTKRKIKAVLPMHTFGLPAKTDQLLAICQKYQLILLEDAAESLGSYYKGRHTGTFGLFGILSFNGNKTITTGGGGMILCNDQELASKAKHLTTTAKSPHRWEFIHDQVAFNYRMPNINAALGCAQLEKLPEIIWNKRKTALMYCEFFKDQPVDFISEQPETQSNYWLNAIVLKSLEERNRFLEVTNDNGIMTRPIWQLMNKLPMFKDAPSGNLDNSNWLEERVVNLPSSVR